ncbi:MAG: hypothetical protein Q9224_002026 [Gallowayella concinna]
MAGQRTRTATKRSIYPLVHGRGGNMEAGSFDLINALLLWNTQERRLKGLSQSVVSKLLARRTLAKKRVSYHVVARTASSPSEQREPPKPGFSRSGSPLPRTLFVSLAPSKQSHDTSEKTNGLEELSLQWTYQFAQIYRDIYFDRSVRNRPSAFPNSIADWILSEDRNDVVRFWERAITGLPLEKCRLLWQEIMLWALQHQIDKAISLLHATFSEPSITAPRYAVEDALKFIISEFLEDQEVVDLETKDKLHDLFRGFAKASILRDDCTYTISQKIIYWLIRHSEDPQVHTLYEVLLNARLCIHPHTFVHFMNRYTRMGRPDLAMEALRRIAASGANVSHDAVQYSCTIMLRTRFDEVEWYKIQSHMVTDMLALGIRPGIYMLNAMILNAVQACDYQTAHAIFETARIHGIRRDTHTYAIILKGALQTLDANLVEKIMHMAEEDGTLPRNNELVFNLIITMLEIAQRTSTVLNRANQYRAILKIYARYCNILPLQELGIYHSMDEHYITTSAVQEPSTKVISIMLVSYMRLRGSPTQVDELYRRYQSHVENNHPLIAATAETDHVAHAFLLRLGRNSTTIKTFPVILSNMLEPLATTAVTVARPNVQTWSIVATFYSYRGQGAAAEKIIGVMKENGVEPNDVTWNTIISGYASMQDVSRVVNALKGMKLAGFETNSYTHKALARLTDRNELLDALQKAAAQDEATWADEQAESDAVRITAGLELETDGLQYQSTAVVS